MVCGHRQLVLACSDLLNVLVTWRSTRDEVRTGHVVVPGLDKSDDVQLPTADPLLDVGAFVVYRLDVQQPDANGAEWIVTMDASQYASRPSNS